jgi:FtsH-binding integral membrane protein
MKKHFELDTPYKFMWNDWVALANVINVFLTIRFSGIVTSWIGMLVNLACVAYDIIKVRRINLALIHSSVATLNAYYLCTYYL